METIEISYIIGRMNPPHAGHIHLIRSMIEQSESATPVIMLGNGPKNLRTIENPLDFETKKTLL